MNKERWAKYGMIATILIPFIIAIVCLLTLPSKHTSSRSKQTRRTFKYDPLRRHLDPLYHLDPMNHIDPLRRMGFYPEENK